MTKSFSVRLPVKQRDELTALADKTGVSASDWTKLAIEQLLRRMRSVEPQQAA